MFIKSAFVASKSKGSPSRVSVMASRMVSVGTCSLPTMRTSSTNGCSWAVAVSGSAPAAATVMSKAKVSARFQLVCMLLGTPSRSTKNTGPDAGRLAATQFVLPKFESCRRGRANAVNKGRSCRLLFARGRTGHARPRVSNFVHLGRRHDVQVEILRSEHDVGRRTRGHYPAAPDVSFRPTRPVRGRFFVFGRVGDSRRHAARIVSGVFTFNLVGPQVPAPVKLGHDLVVALAADEFV